MLSRCRGRNCTTTLSTNTKIAIMLSLTSDVICFHSHFNINLKSSSIIIGTPMIIQSRVKKSNFNLYLIVV
jgi:hypothetical protein